MATLVTLHADGTETRTPVFKSLTTIGGDPESDVALFEPGQPALVAHITYDGTTFTIATSDKRSDIHVSGKPVRKQTLTDGDTLVIGQTRMRFDRDDTPRLRAVVDDQHELRAYRRLVDFSKKLGAATEVQTLLAALMDEVVALTGADKGFLVLVENDVPRVRVARNLRPGFAWRQRPAAEHTAVAHGTHAAHLGREGSDLRTQGPLLA